MLLLAATSIRADDNPHAWTADPAVVAELQKRKPNRNFDESKVPVYTLPDPLLCADGSRVTTPERWEHRRAEILELYRREMFGRSPGKPAELKFDVTHENPRALNGAATLKRVSIISRHEGREHPFEVLLFIPNAIRKPVPAFVLICNRPRENIDPTRQTKSPFWPVEEINARGFATATFYYGDVAPDKADTYRDGIIKLFEGDRAPRKPDAWKSIAAWAWGASRVLDYLETDVRIDAKKVAVIGHSRGGKTALWASAEDPRFALAISNNSGECGASIARRRYGELLKETDGVNPHWFCDNFAKYHDREPDLPFDSHMLIALSSPRAVYVASASDDLSADPKGEFLGLAHASPVFALWNHPPIGIDEMPLIETPLLRQSRAYHVRRGVHDLLLYDWQRYMDFADRLWR